MGSNELAVDIGGIKGSSGVAVSRVFICVPRHEVSDLPRSLCLSGPQLTISVWLKSGSA
jgi:hypothetical protein